MLEFRLMRTRLSVSLLFLSAFILCAQTTSEVAITAEPHHHLALQNQYVRVFKVELAPHEATLMHRHQYDSIFLTVGASQVEHDVAGKLPVTLKSQYAETRLFRGGFVHTPLAL